MNFKQLHEHVFHGADQVCNAKGPRRKRGDLPPKLAGPVLDGVSKLMCVLVASCRNALGAARAALYRNSGPSHQVPTIWHACPQVVALEKAIPSLKPTPGENTCAG